MITKDFSLPVLADELSRLVEGYVSVGQFLDTLFEKKDARTVFCQSLASYYYENGGSPEVREFVISDVKFNSERLSGSFKCSFKVYYFFTCSDIKNDKNDYLTYTFKIDKTTNTIALTGEEQWIIN